MQNHPRKSESPRVTTPAAFTTSVTRRMDPLDPKLLALARAGGPVRPAPANDARRPPPLPRPSRRPGAGPVATAAAELARNAPFVDAELLVEDDAELIEVDVTWLE